MCVSSIVTQDGTRPVRCAVFCYNDALRGSYINVAVLHCCALCCVALCVVLRSVLCCTVALHSVLCCTLCCVAFCAVLHFVLCCALSCVALCVMLHCAALLRCVVVGVCQQTIRRRLPPDNSLPHHILPEKCETHKYKGKYKHKGKYEFKFKCQRLCSPIVSHFPQTPLCAPR